MDSVSLVAFLFAQIDKDVAEFQLKSALRCPNGCGVCCPGADVQTTILELLPAAREIFRRGSAACFEARLEQRTDAGLCAFYITEIAPDELGHCGFYEFRPAVCRLFGFSSVRTRLGNLVLSACKHLKSSNPTAVAAAAAFQSEAPCLSGYGARISAIDPSLGTRLLPINAALRNAMAYVGLRMQLAHHERLGTVTAA